MDKGLIQSVLSSKVVLAIAFLVAADFVTGLIAALRGGKFAWPELGRIFPKDVLASLLAVGVQVVGQAQGGVVDSIAQSSTFAVLVGVMGHSIAGNLEEITNGRIKVQQYVDRVTAWLVGRLKR